MAKLVVCPHEDADGEVCGAEVRADDEDVVISTVRAHAESEHDLKLSRSDVEEMMREV
jgi:predicted small metal-binding protein